MERANQRHVEVRRSLVSPTLSNEEDRHMKPSSRKREARLEQERTPAPQSTGEPEGGVYIISVAARILNMHPQTLRKYERLGLVTPSRSVGMLRLYSAENVVRVRMIKYLVEDLGMNLAGVEFALNLLNRVTDLRERVQKMPRDEEVNRYVLQELGEMLRQLDEVFPDDTLQV